MPHKILILGAGGREHALAYSLSKSSKVKKLYYAAGIIKDGIKINPAMAEIAQLLSSDIINSNNIIKLCSQYNIDFVVIGPEAPLEAGVADDLRDSGLKVFGPSKEAARLESSKIFTKNLCKEHDIPTAKYSVFDNLDLALEGVKEFDTPVVIKADGLASGKGVVIAENHTEAETAIKDMFGGTYGKAGSKIVIEEFLEGEEASFFVLCDGNNIIPLVSAQDHKRAFDGDKGPNTGGMGAYSPAPIMDDIVTQKTLDKIINPTINALKQKGIEFKGVLYAGLMIHNQEPSLIEYNVRFGDPECQVIMSRLQSDIFDLLYGSATSFDDVSTPIWSDNSALTVVMASDGYPKSPKKGCEINIPKTDNDEMIYHAGTKMENGKLLSNGGRVLSVTALGDDILSAKKNAYDLVQKIDFSDGFYRNDIGFRAINRG